MLVDRLNQAFYFKTKTGQNGLHASCNQGFTGTNQRIGMEERQWKHNYVLVAFYQRVVSRNLAVIYNVVVA